MKLLGIFDEDFDVTFELLMIYSAFCKYLRIKLEYNEAVHQLLTYVK
jgi:predicted NUDIX family phosphoesterase